MFFMNLFSGHGTLIKGEGTTINFFFPKELGPTEKYGLSVTIKKIIKFLQTRNLQFSHRLINLIFKTNLECISYEYQFHVTEMVSEIQEQKLSIFGLHNQQQAKPLIEPMDFPGGSSGRAFAYNARDQGSIPRSGRFPGEGNGNPLQYSCLENPMDREAWQATVRGGSQRAGHN